MTCTCPSIRCPIHGEPVPPGLESWDVPEEGLTIPEFIREHRRRQEAALRPCAACQGTGVYWNGDSVVPCELCGRKP